MIGELLAGVGALPRGARVLTRRPRLFLLGALPPLMITVLFVGLLVLLITQLDVITIGLTPFANDWSPTLAALLRLTLAVSLTVGAGLVMIVAFSTVTLALGSPLYDQIAEQTEQVLGDPPAALDDPVVRAAGRAVGQSVVLILISILGAVVIALIGLIPVVGGVVGAVLGAVFGGWMLATELVGSACDRRGRRTLGQRRALLRTSRFRTLGFAVPVFLLMAVPLLAVIVFPAATAGGTILARDLLARRPAGNLPPV